MVDLRLLVGDLINKTKLSSDTKEKLFNLQQIKEIIFYRDPSMLLETVSLVFDLMLERAIQVRLFLVRMAGDGIRQDVKIAPFVLALFSFLIVDGNDKIMESIVRVLSKYYDKISVFVANFAIRAPHSFTTSSDLISDAKELWIKLRSVASVLLELVATNRSENLRIECLKLCESIVLFGLPSLSQDPRLQRSSTSNVNEISLHHPFINRNDIEKEADATLAKMVLWARRGGPQNHSFSATLMAHLGGSLGRIVNERPKSATTIIPALIFLIQAKGSMLANMNKSEKNLLLSILNCVIQNNSIFGHSGGGSEAVDMKANLESAKRNIQSALDNEELQNQNNANKRKLGEVDVEDAEEKTAAADNDDYEYLDVDETLLQQSAVEAVDRSINLSNESVIQSSNDNRRVQVYMGPSIATANTTILATDLGVFASDHSTTIRLATVVDNTADMNLLGSDPEKKKKQNFTNLIRPLVPPADIYSNLSLGTLCRLLHTCIETLINHETPSHIVSKYISQIKPHLHFYLEL
jgi:hypothetical protein